MTLNLKIFKILLLCMLPAITGAASADKDEFSFGIVPQQSAAKLARLWGPLLHQIGQQTGFELKFKTAPDIPTFEKRLAAGEYDFAYMNPYHYTVFHDKPGYRALAKARDKRIKGIMVVHRESSITEIDQLSDSTLAFPAPAAFAASILTRGNLQASGIDFEARYVSSHDSVYRTVAKGLYPAGGGVVRTLNNVSPEIRQQLRILWTSDGYTPHAIATHPRITQNKASALQAALVNLEQTESGQGLLKNIKIKGFEAANNEDWDDVRSLNLQELANF